MKYEFSDEAKRLINQFPSPMARMILEMVDIEKYIDLIKSMPLVFQPLFNKTIQEIKPTFDGDEVEDLTDPEVIDETIDETEEEVKSENAIELINLIHASNIDRNIERLILHCTATNQSASVSAIKKYWKNKLGWKNPGYHIIVKPDGSWTYLLDFNKISNGVAGYNSTSINVSYIGGIDSNGDAIDNRTEEQKKIFDIVVKEFKSKLKLTVHGHNEFSNKACPSFKYPKEF